MILTYLLYHFNFTYPFTIQFLNPHLQALQKICLVDHRRHMADLMHADAVQQLEVALLGLPTAEVVDLLLMDLSKSKPSMVTTV